MTNAFKYSMFRIVAPEPGKDPSVYVLEGKLSRLYVNEFLRCVRETGVGRNCFFDLESVSYVDALGEEALCWVSHMGGCFVADSVYGRELCNRLGLRWVCCIEEGMQPKAGHGRAS